MRLTLCALALGGALLGGCAGGTSDETDSDESTDSDTSYEGARVRKADAGWRLPGPEVAAEKK